MKKSIIIGSLIIAALLFYGCGQNTTYVPNLKNESEEEKFCAKNSGKVGELTECGKKVKTCVLDDGTLCPLDAFFAGECKKGVIVEWGEQCR